MNTVNINSPSKTTFQDLPVGALFRMFISGNTYMKVHVSDNNQMYALDLQNGVTYTTDPDQKVYTFENGTVVEIEENT